jgi:segregation and condensation protein A
MSAVATLDLDLDLFSGPFDLLLTLVLREEVDLLELSLAELVLSYLDHLESRGELDLEAATEFIVLIAALLELKSRLMLAGEDEEEVLDIAPGMQLGELGQAAEELLARMLDARRYRSAAARLRELLAREDGVRFRQAPPPAHLRRSELAPEEGSQAPAVLGEAIGRLLAMPPAISLRHIAIPRVSVAERLTHLRGLLARGGAFSFDEAVRGADRMTVAVTLFALLELYKRGEADWRQEESFGEVTIASGVALDPGSTADATGPAAAVAEEPTVTVAAVAG